MITFLRRSPGVRLRRSLCCLLALSATCVAATAENITVTDENGVVYDVIAGTTNVEVSTINASVFKDKEVDITIPLTVKDHATLSSDKDTDYHVVSLRPEAFRGTSITSFTIEVPITEFSDDAFSKCSNLASIKFPATVTSIGDRAFYECGALAEISEIPLVTSIGEEAFIRCTSLKSIELPNVLTFMGERAFRESGLESITIPSSLSAVPKEAFNSCPSLAEATFEEGVMAVDERAFEKCSALANINFHESMTLWEYSFAECTGIDVLTLKAGMNIKIWAFSKAGIKSIAWPESKLYLDDSVFENVTRLTEIVLPDWMERVPSRTFYTCYDLEKLVLNEGLTTIGSGAFAFVRTVNSKLSDVNFAEGATNTLTTIETGAFTYNGRLCEFPFMEGMTIGNSAFSHCGFTSITLLKDMSVGSLAFECPLTAIYWPEEPMKFVGPEIFGCNAYISTMEFPGWLETIPEKTCQSWPALKAVILKEGTKSIGARAFEYTTNLTNIILPSTLEEIGTRAFLHLEDDGTCEKPGKIPVLATLVLPKSLKRIGACAFQGQQKLLYIYPNGETASAGHAIFNEGLEDIGRAAFSACFRLTYIDLPSSIQSIGYYSFGTTLRYYKYKGSTSSGEWTDWCGCITTVDLSKTSLTEIPSHAFYNNPSLTTVKWPADNTIKKIGDYAFLECPLQYTSFPSSVEEVGAYAFAYNYSGNGNVKGVSYYSQRYVAPADKYCAYDMSNVKSIGGYAFCGRRVLSVTWPKKALTTVGSHVFDHTNGLESVSFPDWMKEVPAAIFYRSSDLTTVNFNKVETIKASAFNGCAKLQYRGDDQPTAVLRFPESVKIIESDAFAYTGTEAFPYTLELGDGVEAARMAFNQAWITSVKFTGCPATLEGVFNGTKIKRLELPDCLVDIPDRLCEGMSEIEEIVFPENVRTIGEGAFSGCSKVTVFDIPATVEEIGDLAFSNSGITDIHWPTADVKLGQSVFSSTPLTEVTIPAYLDSIPSSTFSNCSKLTKVVWEARNGRPFRISESAFSQCYALEHITMPEGVTEIGDMAFNSCPSLKTADFPSTLTTIGEAAFKSSSQFTGPYPKSVTKLGSGAFRECDLREVHLNDAIEEVPQHCFRENMNLATLTLGSGLKRIGTYAFQNCYSLNDFDLNEGLEEIDENAFQNNRKLTRIELPSTLRRLGGYAFEGSSSSISGDFFINTDIAGLILEGKDIDIPYYYDRNTGIHGDYVNVTADRWANEVGHIKTVVNHSPDIEIGPNAFAYQYFLTDYTADYSPEYISNGMFFNCYNLRNVKLPEGTVLTGVQGYAFTNCMMLESFPYQSKVYIGSQAFHGCQSLKQIIYPTGEDVTFSLGEKDQTLSNCNVSIDEDGIRHTDGSFYRTSYSTFDYHSRYALNLQSVIFPYEGKYFMLDEKNINCAPLRGVSYCYSYGLIPNNYNLPQYYNQGYRPSYTIKQYAQAYESKYYTDYLKPAESILMVRRGQKWKFIEAGYGKRFNIIEMKEPKPYMEGDIYSEYDEAQNVNHYRVMLRWELELSDLNPDGETRAEIMRDGKLVAKVKFGQPKEISGSSVGLSTERVTAVTVDIEGDMQNSFVGDYEYPVEVKSTNIYNDPTTESLWILYYNLQEPTLYFDAESGRRLSAIETYGYRSWFTLVDYFDSEPLDSRNVSDRYIYTARIKGYRYMEYVNNENFEEIDGRLYHMEPREMPEWIISDDCVVTPDISALSVTFPSMYSTAEVAADRDGSLARTRSHSEGRDYTLTNALDSKLVKEKVYVVARDEIHDIITGVETRALDNDKAVIRTMNPHPAEGVVVDKDEYVVNSTAGVIQPGDRYQTVVSTFKRGTFGSRVVSVPDIPTLEAQLVIEYHDHMGQGGHAYGGFKGHMYLTPDVRPLGYDNTMPGADEFHLGVWRSLSVTDINYSDWMDVPAEETASLLADDGNTVTELVHHVGGRPDDVTELHCSGCAEGAQCVADDNQIVHTDVFDVEDFKQFDVLYNTRLYVKVPTAYTTTDEDRWVAVDAVDKGKSFVLTGIENVTVDGPAADDSDAMWFDLQGRRVLSPTPGNVYLKVSRQGNYKVRYI